MIQFTYDEEARAVYVNIQDDDAVFVTDSKVMCEDPLITLDYHHAGDLCGIEIILPEQK